jgi:hypothetical protein
VFFHEDFLQTKFFGYFQLHLDVCARIFSHGYKTIVYSPRHTNWNSFCACANSGSFHCGGRAHVNKSKPHAGFKIQRCKGLHIQVNVTQGSPETESNWNGKEGGKQSKSIRLKIKYNFTIKGWKRGHNILKTSKHKERKMTGKKVYKSLFEVESMSFCWADGLRSLQGCWNTAQWSLSTEARVIRQVASVPKLGNNRTCLLMLTAATENCRSSVYSTWTQLAFSL